MIFNNCNAQLVSKAEIKKIDMTEYINLNMTNPAEDLYDLSWDNSKVHTYKNIRIIKNYKIDLTDFAMPIKKNDIKITSKFGYRAKFKRNHCGIDLKCNIGDTIYAAFSGKIRISNIDRRGYGKHIVIRHFNGLETIYGHMSKLLVKANEYVKAGDPIGLGGNTGRSFGSHLHLEIRFCGISIDPLKIFDFNHQDIIDDNYRFK